MSKFKKPEPMTVRPEAEFRFDARLFAATAVFMAQTDIRYYLNGVCFFPHPQGGALLAATDGHQMAVAYDSQGCAAAETIFSVKAGNLAAAKRHKRGTVHVDGSRLVVADIHGNEAHVQPGKAKIEGKFPDIWRMLPKPDEEIPRGMLNTMNPLLVARIASAAKALAWTTRFGTAMDCWSRSSDSVVYTRLSAEENFLILTMPMKRDNDWGPAPQKILSGRALPKAAPEPKIEDPANPGPHELTSAPATAPAPLPQQQPSDAAPPPVEASAPATAPAEAPAAPAPAPELAAVANALAAAVQALQQFVAPKV